MDKKVTWKTMLIVGLMLGSIYCLLPSLSSGMGEKGKKWLKTEPIALGLDLKGGIHLRLDVQVEKAVQATLTDLADAVRARARDTGLALAKVEVAPGYRIVLEPKEAERADELLGICDDVIGKKELTRVPSEGPPYVFEMGAKAVQNRKDRAVEQALETIRNRVDQYGVREPTIIREGDTGIVVQLPGVENPAEVKKLLVTTARLEFKMIDEAFERSPEFSKALEGLVFHEIDDRTKARVTSILKDVLPEDDEWYFERKVDDQGKVTQVVPRVAHAKEELGGEHLTDAEVRMGGRGLTQTVHVSFTLDAIGADKFERLTGENVGRFLAIILDDTIYSAPVIKTKISGGSGIIEGSFTTKEAHNLAIVLRAGSLPAPLLTTEERTVGPTLGRDLIRKGKISTIVAGVLVVAFMGLYYRRTGLIANFALCLNLLFLMAAMSLLGTTLTLPGVAGIVLTMGMAVDANVLINERIREEARLGKTPRAAVDAGYEKAWSAILDSNLTTLISGLVLFQFGTGPIRGFAATLSIGILTSMFTAVFVTHAVFEYLLATRRIRTLSV